MPTFEVSAALSTEHCWPQACNVQQKVRLKVQRWGFKCFGVWVLGVFKGVLFFFGFKGGVLGVGCRV